MKFGIQRVKSFRTLCYDTAKVVVGSAIIMPMLSTLNNNDSPSWTYVAGAVSMAIMLCVSGLYLDGKIEEMESDNNIKTTSSRRRHRIHVPKNTSILVDIEK